MSVAGRGAIAAVGLVAFLWLTIDEAREVRTRLGIAVPLLLIATGATFGAGLVHLALTPDHWREARPYGLFFLLAGLAQLVLASMISGRHVGQGSAIAMVLLNAGLILAYVVTRLVPPFGADLPEPLDRLGVTTVAAEAVASTIGVFVVARLRRGPAISTERPGTDPSCPGPRARGDGSGRHSAR